MQNTIKGVMMGGSRVGKTCFMAANIHELYYGCKQTGDISVTMNAIGTHGDRDPATGVLAMNKMADYDDIEALINHHTGTAFTTDLDFSIRVTDGSKTAEVSYFSQDYAGGTITENAGEESFRRAAELCDADVIYLFLDGSLISKYGSVPEPQLRRVSGAGSINVFMGSLYEKKPKDNVVVNVVITKADATDIPANLKADNYKGLREIAVRLLNKTFGEAKELKTHHNWRFLLSVCSAVGEGNTIQVRDGNSIGTRLKGANYHQEGCDTALLAGIIHHLKARTLAAEQREQECIDEIASLPTGLFSVVAKRKIKEALWEEISNLRSELSRLKTTYEMLYGCYADELPKVYVL